MDFEKILNDIYLEANAIPKIGNVATSIPELAKIDGAKFGINVLTLDNNNFHK